MAYTYADEKGGMMLFVDALIAKIEKRLEEIEEQQNIVPLECPVWNSLSSVKVELSEILNYIHNPKEA